MFNTYPTTNYNVGKGGILLQVVVHDKESAKEAAESFAWALKNQAVQESTQVANSTEYPTNET